jgi:hypothetical protein
MILYGAWLTIFLGVVMIRFPRFPILLILPLAWSVPFVGTPLAAACSSEEWAAVREAKPGIRVLFVGNSHTYTDDLPGLIRGLVENTKGAKPFISCQSTPGGYTLERHWTDGQVVSLLQQAQWDYVVFQEQSQRPSFSAAQRQRQMDPYVRQLKEAIVAAQATPLLFMTWAHHQGDIRNNPEDTYWRMQQRIQEGYQALGRSFSIEVISVGIAWEKALRSDQSLALWDPDGSHPGLKGSYLAACVFYAYLYQRSPVDNPFTAGLSPAEAKVLQQVAAEVASRKQ